MMRLPFTSPCEDALICIVLICFNQITLISGEKQIPRRNFSFNQITLISGEKQIPRRNFQNKSKINVAGLEKELRRFDTLKSTQEGETFSNNEIAGVFKRRVPSLTYKHQNRHLLNKNQRVHLSVLQKNKQELYNRVPSATIKSFGHKIRHHHRRYAHDRNRGEILLYSNRNPKKTPSIRHDAKILRPKVFARAKGKHKNHKLKFSINTRRQMKKIKHRKLTKRARKQLRHNNGQIGGNSHNSIIFSTNMENRSKNKHHHRMKIMETPFTIYDFLSLARHLKSWGRKNHRRKHRLHNLKNEDSIESEKKGNERPKHGRYQNLNHRNFKSEERYNKNGARKAYLLKPYKNVLTKNVVQKYRTHRRRLHSLLFQNKDGILHSRVAEKRRFSNKELQRRKQFDSSPYHNCFGSRTGMNEIRSQQKHKCKPTRNSLIKKGPRKKPRHTEKLLKVHHNHVHLFHSDTKRKENYQYKSLDYFSSQNKKRVNQFQSKKLKGKLHHHFSTNERKHLRKRHNSLLQRVKMESRANKKFISNSVGSKRNRKSGVSIRSHKHQNKPRKGERLRTDLIMKKANQLTQTQFLANKIQNEKHHSKFRKQKKYLNGRSNTFFKTTKQSNVPKHGTIRNMADSKKVNDNPRRAIFLCKDSQKEMKEMIRKLKTAVRRSIIIAKIIGKKFGIDDKTIEAILTKKEAKISSKIQKIK